MEYLKSLIVLSKPVLTYLGVKTGFLVSTYTAEWYTARIYSKMCIGEGINGYFNHIWNMASPSCTGLLMSHISFLGIFIASVCLSFLTGIVYIYKNYMKEEFMKTKKFIKDIS